MLEKTPLPPVLRIKGFNRAPGSPPVESNTIREYLHAAFTNGMAYRRTLMIAAYAALVPGISRISAQNALPVIHKTATNRIINPVGETALTPNFAIGVVGSGQHVVVEATGAAYRQTLTMMNADNLTEQAQMGFLKGKPWNKHVLPGMSRQSLFQGIAAGPHGMIYAAGGVSNNILALRVLPG